MLKSLFQSSLKQTPVFKKSLSHIHKYPLYFQSISLNFQKNTPLYKFSSQQQQQQQKQDFNTEYLDLIYNTIESDKQKFQILKKSNIQDSFLQKLPQIKNDIQAIFKCIKLLNYLNLNEENRELKELLVQYLKKNEIQTEHQITQFQQNLPHIQNFFLESRKFKKQHKELERFFLNNIELINYKSALNLLKSYQKTNCGKNEFIGKMAERIFLEVNKLNEKEILIFLNVMSNLNCFWHKDQVKFFSNFIEQQLDNNATENIKISPISLFLGLNFEETIPLHQKFLQYVYKERIADSKKETVLSHYEQRVFNNFLVKCRVNTYSKCDIIDKILKIQPLPIPKIQHHLKLSDFQQEAQAIVCGLLDIRKKNIDIETELRVEIYKCDLVINDTIIIEFNGKYHYMGNRREGLYELKYQNLNSFGYEVIEIPKGNWFLWNSEEKTQYIKQIILKSENMKKLMKNSNNNEEEEQQQE